MTDGAVGISRPCDDNNQEDGAEEGQVLSSQPALPHPDVRVAPAVDSEGKRRATLRALFLRDPP